MVKKEKQNFEFNFTIRESGGKVVELKKRQVLEITWDGDIWTLNPEKKKFEGYRWSKGETVRFEKGGKNYDIIIQINQIKKGWFRDKTKEINGPFPAPGSDLLSLDEVR